MMKNRIMEELYFLMEIIMKAIFKKIKKKVKENMFYKVVLILRVNIRMANEMETELNSILIKIFRNKVFGMTDNFKNEFLNLINLYIYI